MEIEVVSAFIWNANKVCFLVELLASEIMEWLCYYTIFVALPSIIWSSVPPVEAGIQKKDVGSFPHSSYYFSVSKLLFTEESVLINWVSIKFGVLVRNEQCDTGTAPETISGRCALVAFLVPISLIKILRFRGGHCSGEPGLILILLLVPWTYGLDRWCCRLVYSFIQALFKMNKTDKTPALVELRFLNGEKRKRKETRKMGKTDSMCRYHHTLFPRK